CPGRRSGMGAGFPPARSPGPLPPYGLGFGARRPTDRITHKRKRNLDVAPTLVEAASRCRVSLPAIAAAPRLAIGFILRVGPTNSADAARGFDAGRPGWVAAIGVLLVEDAERALAIEHP